MTHAMSSPADQPAPGVGRDPTVAARVEQLYASHASLVRSICRSLLRDRSEAEDAIQQTFLSAQRALANGSSPRDEIAWLATIARHECLARVRARMREPLPLELDEGCAALDAHAAAVRRHEAGELREALAELPAQQREAILLREVRGLSYQEVASSLSVTTAAVESLLFRARRRLQTRLREALAGLSPGWLRDLAGGGLAGPVAAKVAAVNLGTAVATGSAVVGPTVIGLGHAPAPSLSAPPASSHRPAAPAGNGTIWGTAAPRPTSVVSDPPVEQEISDRQASSDTRDREPASDTGAAIEISTAASTSDSTTGDSRDGPSDAGKNDSGSRD